MLLKTTFSSIEAPALGLSTCKVFWVLAIGKPVGPQFHEWLKVGLFAFVNTASEPDPGLRSRPRHDGT